MAPREDYEVSDDDLDELASSDETDDGDDSKPTDIVTQLKGQLKEPRFKTVNLRQLNDLIQLGNVDLNPDYQRDVVWTEPKMIALIQSLFLNYYVPPVIFAVAYDEEAQDDVRTCIDGKQRCTSIMRFIEGKVPFKSPATNEKFWYTSFPTFQKGGKPLPPALRRKFDNISIQVVEYEDIDMDQQRDIFQRVQLGVALTAAEKMEAMSGPWVSWIAELKKKFVVAEGGLGHLLPKLKIERGSDFQMILSFIMIVVNEGARITPSSSTQTTFLKRSDNPDPEFRHKVELTLTLLVQICTDMYPIAIGTVKERVAPVEFWFMLIIVYSRMGCMSVERLAHTISDMRKHVRSKWKDLRSNTSVTKDLYDFMDTVPRTKQPGEIAAVEQFDNGSYNPHAAKRARDAEDQDPSYHPGDAGATYRGRDQSAPTLNLRSNKKPKSSSSSQQVSIKRSPPPSPTRTAPAAASRSYVPNAETTYYAPRPPVMSMDAPLPTQQPAQHYPTQTVRNMYNGSNNVYNSSNNGAPRPNPHYPNQYHSPYNL